MWVQFTPRRTCLKAFGKSSPALSSSSLPSPQTLERWWETVSIKQRRLRSASGMKMNESGRAASASATGEKMPLPPSILTCFDVVFRICLWVRGRHQVGRATKAGWGLLRKACTWPRGAAWGGGRGQTWARTSAEPAALSFCSCLDVRPPTPDWSAALGAHLLPPSSDSRLWGA